MKKNTKNGEDLKVLLSQNIRRLREAAGYSTEITAKLVQDIHTAVNHSVKAISSI